MISGSRIRSRVACLRLRYLRRHEDEGRGGIQHMRWQSINRDDTCSLLKTFFATHRGIIEEKSKAPDTPSLSSTSISSAAEAPAASSREEPCFVGSLIDFNLQRTSSDGKVLYWVRAPSVDFLLSSRLRPNTATLCSAAQRRTEDGGRTGQGSFQPRIL